MDIKTYILNRTMWTCDYQKDDLRQVVLLTQMAKFCCAIRPPCGANELPSDEASSCLDTYFTQDIGRLLVVGGSFAPQSGPFKQQQKK